MMKFILILTLFYYKGPSVIAVEFESKEACLSAGDAWLKEMKKVSEKTMVYMIPNAMCVPKGKI